MSTNYDFITKKTELLDNHLDRVKRVMKLFPKIVKTVFSKMSKSARNREDDYCTRTGDEIDLYLILIEHIDTIESYYDSLKPEIDWCIEYSRLGDLKDILKNASIIIETKQIYNITSTTKGSKFLCFLHSNREKISQIDNDFGAFVTEFISQENQPGLQYLIDLK